MSTAEQPQARAGKAIARLMELVRRLRAPDGCPWDRAQTVASSARYLLEEAYEAVDALERGDEKAAMEELGDVLFQVVFQAQIFAEQGAFTLADVLEAVEAKMIRRHPHVFGEARVETAEDVLRRWGEMKAAERKQKGAGLLEGLVRSAPALVVARKLGGRLARVGFDWKQAQDVLAKLGEELGELERAGGREEMEAELGDVLFSIVQWARHKGLDPETALRKANARFIERVELMHRLAASRGLKLEELELGQLDELWEEAKTLAASGPRGEQGGGQ